MTERWICARCFTSAEADATVCPNCGLERGATPEAASGDVDAPRARLDDTHPDASPAEAASAAAPMAMAAASGTRFADRWVCRQCFFSNEGMASACTNCGLSRGSAGPTSADGAGSAAPAQPTAGPKRAIPWRLVMYGVIAVVVLGGTLFVARRGDTGEITDAGNMSVFDLVVGDCFDVPNATGDVDTVKGIPCGEAHTYEVFWTGEYPGDIQPAEDEALSWLQDGCMPAFEAYVGLAYADSIYYMGSLSPTEDSWATGDRAFACYLSNASETAITGSAEGTAQ
jgi:hypothetical protein